MSDHQLATQHNTRHCIETYTHTHIPNIVGTAKPMLRENTMSTSIMVSNSAYLTSLSSFSKERGSLEPTSVQMAA